MAGGPHGATSGAMVQPLKRVLPSTEAQARRIEHFFDEHISGSATDLAKLD